MTTRPHRRLRSDAPLGLRRDACLPLNFRYAGCTACEDACPTRALKLTVDGMALSHACTGCGRCASACATGALRLEGCDLPQPLPAGTGAVRVDCRKVPATDSAPGTVRVPCIDALSVSQWLALVEGAQGRPVEVMDRGWCGACNAGGGDLASQAFDQALALLAQVRWPLEQAPIRRAAPLPLRRMPTTIPLEAPQPAMSRRGFFGHVARGATAAAAAATEALEEPARDARVRPGALAAPERRRRVEILERLAARTGSALPASLFPSLRVADACRGHEVCSGVCPTQALHTYDDGRHAGIAFDAADCVACGACINACPSRAIAFEAPAAPRGRGATRLTRRDVHECPDCGARAGSAGEPCDRCRGSLELAADAFAAIFHSAACADHCAGEPGKPLHHEPGMTRGGSV